MPKSPQFVQTALIFASTVFLCALLVLPFHPAQHHAGVGGPNTQPGAAPVSATIKIDTDLSTLSRDASGLYAIFPLAIDGSQHEGGGTDVPVLSDALAQELEDQTRYFEGAAPAPATLATHMTPGHILHTVLALRTWTGRLSAAVFVTDEAELAVAAHTIAYIHACHPGAARRTDVHFVFVVPAEPSTSRLSVAATVAGRCLELTHATLPAVMSFIMAQPALAASTHSAAANYALRVAYPNNLLRNVAVRGATHETVVVLDVDMVPSRGLAAVAASMLAVHGTHSKIALVAPSESRVHAHTQILSKLRISP